MSLRSLVEALRVQRDAIVARFVKAVQGADLAPPGTPRSALVDHIPVFLDEVSAALEKLSGATPAAPAPSPGEPSRQHAGQRWRLGYDVGALVREYGIVRRCILEVVEEKQVALTPSDFNALAEQVNAGIAQSVSAYVAYRDEQLASEQASVKFLSDAGELLSSSLDYRSTLSRLAGLLVPRLADWCAIYLDGTSVEEMPITHLDPAKVPVAREILRRSFLDDSPRGFRNVMRTGTPLLMRETNAAVIDSIAQDDEHRRLLEKLHSRSWIIVPLRVQDTTFGALTMAYSESDRRYDEHDLVLAGDLARRAAVAIDNARLYQLSQDERSKVEAATRAKDEFVAMVSHELRTPLTAILGWLHLMNAGKLNEAKKKHGLEVIERNAMAQSRLVGDLLDISRIITGKIRITLSQTDLSNIIDMAIEGVLPAAEAKRISIGLEMDRGATLMRGDGERLQQVIWNLLANAVKFTPKNGKVSVRVRRVESDLEVIVEDNGVGISPDFMPEIFESFRQADRGAARSQGGLGIGLSIAKHIVELHGGSIQASSAGVGKGSRFEVRLPISPLVSTTVGVSRAPVTRKPEGTPEKKLGLAGVKVLLVDDEPDAVEMLGYIFEDAGAEVKTATSAAAALETLVAFTPHVIISDIGMPVDDGYSLIRSIRTLPSAKKNTPVIALTAFAQSEDRTRALVAGFNRHMIKPVEPVALLRAVEELVAPSADLPAAPARPAQP